MPVQFDGWAYYEADRGNPSPRVSYSADGIRMLRDIGVIPGTMAANYLAAKWFLGYPTYKEVWNPDHVANYISRNTPDYALWTDEEFALIAVIIDDQKGIVPGVRTKGQVPWNDSVSANEYAESLMLVEYRTTNYDIADDADCLQVDTDNGVLQSYYARKNNVFNIPDESLMKRLIERTWNYASHIISMPQGFTCFVPDVANEMGVGVTASPNKGGFPFREGMIELTYVWRDVPLRAMPHQAIQTCLNTMNGAFVNKGNDQDHINYFDPYYWNIPTYCNLFLGARPHVKKLITGEIGVDLEYKFLYAPHVILSGPNKGQLGGWQRALAPLNNVNNPVDYRLMKMFWNNVNLGLGGGPVGVTDHSSLFRPDQP